MDIHSPLTGEKTTHFEHFSDQQKSWQSLEAVFEGLSAFSSFFYKCDPIVTGNRNVMRILPEDLYGDTVGKRLAAHSAQLVLATVADDLSHPGFFIVIRFVTVHSILQVVIRHQYTVFSCFRQGQDIRLPGVLRTIGSLLGIDRFLFPGSLPYSESLHRQL